MVCVDVDPEDLGGCNSIKQSTRARPATLRRSSSASSLCSSVPGRSRAKRTLDEARQAAENLLEMREAAEKLEQQALQQDYNVLDAMMSLQFKASQFRRGKATTLTKLSPLMASEKAKPSSQEVFVLQVQDCTTIRPDSRQSSVSHQSDENEAVESNLQSLIAKRSVSLPKLLKVPKTPSLRVPCKSPCDKPQKKFAKAVEVSIHRNRQLDALNALVTSLDTGKASNELLWSMSRNVLTHLGTKAFTAEQSTLAFEATLDEKGLAESPTVALERVELMVQALRVLSVDAKMPFADVVGQVLWRSRRSECLLKTKKFKETAEDMSWMMPGSGGLDEHVKQAEKLAQLQDVDDAFKMFSSENGRMNSRGWRQVARLVWSSPALAGRLNLSDVDRLWYAHTRPNFTKEVLRDINCNDFKGLMLALAEAMEVHPWMVFFPVASYQRQSLETSPLPSPIGSPCATPRSSSSSSSRDTTPSRSTQTSPSGTAPVDQEQKALVA